MNLISQILELNSSIKKQFSLEKSGMFFFEDHQKQNTDFYELFEHNYNLIVALLEYHYQKIPTDEVERENIIYSLY